MGARSLVLLAWHFLRHVLRKVTFTYDRGGSKRFLENYRADGLEPVSEARRPELAAMQSCIACGLCDATCGTAVPASTLVFVASGVRDLSTLDASAVDARQLACAGCGGCETICPVGVPIRDAVAFVEARAQHSAASSGALEGRVTAA